MQARYVVVKGGNADELTVAINEAAQVGYLPMPGGLQPRGGEMWCLCELADAPQPIEDTDDGELDVELRAAEEAYVAQVEAAKKRHSQVRAGKAPPRAAPNLAAATETSQGSPVVSTADAGVRGGMPGAVPQPQVPPGGVSLDEVRRGEEGSGPRG